MIYLDYNATTPVDPAVFAAMRPYLEEAYANPSSGHAFGKQIRKAYENARQQVADLVGASPDEIIFTSGGTEASNMAIKGAAFAPDVSGKHVVTTSVEHLATIRPLAWLSRFGFTYSEVPVDGNGLVDPDDVKKAIRSDTFMISIMHAQNEVGTIEPIDEIGCIARERDLVFHVDAAQSLGKVPVIVDEMKADLLSIAGHKFYGPKGIGALYVRNGIKIDGFVHGSTQEAGRRGGTENVAMAIGMGKAAEIAQSYLAQGDHTEVRDHFWQSLQERLGGRVVLNGHETLRLPSTLNVSFPGSVGGELLSRLDGVCASTGAACHSHDAKPSRVLTAMGIARERAIGAIRFSVGRPTTRQEVDRVVEMLQCAVRST